MGWPYHFVDLTQDDILARRHALDKYGAIAQASAVAVIIGVAVYQWIFNRKHTSVRAARGPSYARVPTDAPATGGPETSGNNRHGLEQGHGSAEEEVEMQSPAHFADALKDDEDATAEEEEGLMSPTNPQQGVGQQGARAALDEKEAPPRPGRLSAWLDKPLRQGWKETRRQGISVGLWAVWIVSLVFRETGDDYLHTTKRFAQIAAALLPFHYLLGTPSRLSPLPYLFRTSPSSLYNPYHRMHALLIFMLLASHATWYLNFYFWASKLPGRLLDLDVLLGLSMATTFTVMAVLARQAVRYDPKRRPWFVKSHFIAAGLIPCLLFFHAPPARWYAVEMLLVYAGVAFERFMRRREGNQG